MEKYQISALYNDNSKTFIINTHATIGSIFELLMEKYNLYIYSLETIECTISETNEEKLVVRKIDFMNEIDTFNTSFEECMKKESIEKKHNIQFILHDRKRDENGNVIKDNKFINKYNDFLAVINDQMMARSLQNRYDSQIRYNNLLNNIYGSPSVVANAPDTPSGGHSTSVPARQSNASMTFANNLLNIFNVPLNNPSVDVSGNPSHDISGNQQSIPNFGGYTTGSTFPVGQQGLFSNLMNPFMGGGFSTASDTSGNTVGTVPDISGNTHVNPTLTYEFTFDIPLSTQGSVPARWFPTQGPPSVVANVSAQQFYTQSSTQSSINEIYNNFFNLLNSRLGIPAQQMTDVKMILSKDELEALEVKKYKDCKSSDEARCSVCLQSFNDEDDVIKLKCTHIYHPNCIKEWLSTSSNKCPICREEVAKGIPNQDIDSE